jgi:hypothetical protein
MTIILNEIYPYQVNSNTLILLTMVYRATFYGDSRNK